jgi:hypothetical protein
VQWWYNLCGKGSAIYAALCRLFTAAIYWLVLLAASFQWNQPFDGSAGLQLAVLGLKVYLWLWRHHW